MRTALFTASALLLGSLFASAADIPSGTEVRVRTTSAITSATAKSGEKWTGTLAEDLKANGETIARKGDPAEGTIDEVRQSGRLSKTGYLSLTLTSVNNTPVQSASYTVDGGSHKKRNAGAIGGGAALGAIIGGIAGGGKGAAIGAGAGAGAGTVGAAATGKKEVTIPAETVLTFRVR